MYANKIIVSTSALTNRNPPIEISLEEKIAPRKAKKISKLRNENKCHKKNNLIILTIS